MSFQPQPRKNKRKKITSMLLMKMTLRVDGMNLKRNRMYPRIQSKTLLLPKRMRLRVIWKKLIRWLRNKNVKKRVASKSQVLPIILYIVQVQLIKRTNLSRKSRMMISLIHMGTILRRRLRRTFLMLMDSWNQMRTSTHIRTSLKVWVV